MEAGPKADLGTRGAGPGRHLDLVTMDESGDSDAWKPEGEGDDEEAEQSTFSVSGQGFSMDESMEDLKKCIENNTDAPKIGKPNRFTDQKRTSSLQLRLSILSTLVNNEVLFGGFYVVRVE